jgi:flagellar FliL protein
VAAADGEHGAGPKEEAEREASVQLPNLSQPGQQWWQLFPAPVGGDRNRHRHRGRRYEPATPVRDIILTSLGNKTVEDLTDIAKREGIKTEVQTAIVAQFGKGSVKRLYFPQFVVQ